MASTLKVTEITTPDGTGNITVSRPLSSVQLGGVLDVNGNYVQTEKGGDIASASPLVIDTDGDYFDVTGTTNFAAMTVAADRQFTLQFDGALTMTHHATNLDLPGEANITTAAGDVAVFQSTGANTVQCISYVKADGTAVVGSVEGTAVLSTGEAGGTKFLREDGDGTSSWQAAGGGWVELQSVTASSSATVDLETGIGSTYDEYMIKCSKVIPATDATALHCLLKVGGSYVATGYRYHTTNSDDAAATSKGVVSGSDSQIIIHPNQGNGATENSNTTLYFSSPDATSLKHIYWQGGTRMSTDVNAIGSGNGLYAAGSAAQTGVRFLMSSGNIASGIFTLYGLTKA